MSIFRVFRTNADFSFDNQFEGLKIAAAKFKNYFTDGDPDKTFEDFIYGLINTEYCTVTYKKDDPDHCVTTQLMGGKNKRFFFKENGVKTEIKLQGVQDKPDDNKVKMCIPFKKVDPTEPYLADCVSKFKDPNITDSEKEAFLLGLILLKRCR